MNRRSLLAISAALPVLLTVPARAAPGVSEVRVGADPAVARRLQARLGIPVRSVQDGLVGALDAGHLEWAMLRPAELVQARRRMGDRLLVLHEPAGGHAVVTRRVLPWSLRSALAAAST